MRLLLDTHIVQWLTTRPEKLDRAEFRIVNDLANEIFVSAVSLWEMRMKWHTAYRSGQRKGEADPELVVAVLRTGVAFVELPLTFAHCTASLHAPFDHNDPYDRLLLAQAQVEDMRLLTRDDKFEHHPLALFA